MRACTAEARNSEAVGGLPARGAVLLVLGWRVPRQPEGGKMGPNKEPGSSGIPWSRAQQFTGGWLVCDSSQWAAHGSSWSRTSPVEWRRGRGFVGGGWAGGGPQSTDARRPRPDACFGTIPRCWSVCSHHASWDSTRVRWCSAFTLTSSSDSRRRRRWGCCLSCAEVCSPAWSARRNEFRSASRSSSSACAELTAPAPPAAPRSRRTRRSRAWVCAVDSMVVTPRACQRAARAFCRHGASQ
jgi:hypothetical protein